jgi:hypothetical protein
MTQEERKALIRSIYEHPSGFDIDKFYANTTEDGLHPRAFPACGGHRSQPEIR